MDSVDDGRVRAISRAGVQRRRAVGQVDPVPPQQRRQLPSGSFYVHATPSSQQRRARTDGGGGGGGRSARPVVVTPGPAGAADPASPDAGGVGRAAPAVARLRRRAVRRQRRRGRQRDGRHRAAESNRDSPSEELPVAVRFRVHRIAAIRSIAS